MISIIKRASEVETVVNSTKDKLVILYFYATWCMPCKSMNAPIRQLSKSYKNKLILLKINVDKYSKLSDTYGVKLMPTFVLIKNGRKLTTFSGADEELLNKKISKYV